MSPELTFITFYPETLHLYTNAIHRWNKNQFSSVESVVCTGLLTYEEESGVPAEMEAELEDAAQEVDIMRQPSPYPNEDTFRKKLKGTIDVWWLFDDGGMSVCLSVCYPFIRLSVRPLLDEC